MNHLLVTRFAVKTEFGGFTQGPHKALSPGWLARRLQLFQWFCAPSINAQTCQDFRWLVLIDPILEHLERDLKACSPRIEVVLTRDVEHLPHYQEGAEPLVTTRLDSDDGLGRHAIADIQAIVNGDKKDWATMNGAYGISLDLGYKLKLPEGVVYQNGVDNLFLTLVEMTPPNTRLGVLNCSHTEFLEKFPTVHIRKPGMHMIVAHECNVANGFVSAEAVHSDMRDFNENFPLVEVL